MKYPEEKIIRIKSDIENQVRGFIEKMKREVKILKEALAKEDYEYIWIMGKSMMESGQQYGLNDLIPIGTAIEDAAKEKKEKEIRDKTTLLAEWLRSIQIVYE